MLDRHTSRSASASARSVTVTAPCAGTRTGYTSSGSSLKSIRPRICALARDALVSDGAPAGNSPPGATRGMSSLGSPGSRGGAGMRSARGMSSSP